MPDLEDVLADLHTLRLNRHIAPARYDALALDLCGRAGLAAPPWVGQDRVAHVPRARGATGRPLSEQAP